jgi:hypothetical protein
LAHGQGHGKRPRPLSWSRTPGASPSPHIHPTRSRHVLSRFRRQTRA